jgi:hypothetical protein
MSFKHIERKKVEAGQMGEEGGRRTPASEYIHSQALARASGIRGDSFLSFYRSTEQIRHIYLYEMKRTYLRTIVCDIDGRGEAVTSCHTSHGILVLTSGDLPGFSGKGCRRNALGLAIRLGMFSLPRDVFYNVFRFMVFERG